MYIFYQRLKELFYKIEMGNNEIEVEYEKLVKGIEGCKMYDGRGTVDRYICDTCGHMIHTTYRDKGVTPFTIRCPKCNGTMYHKQTFRKEIVPEWIDVKEWYRPTLEETLKLPVVTINHILHGGLLLREER